MTIKLERLYDLRAPILLTGETGVGKSYLAKKYTKNQDGVEKNLLK